MIPMLGGMNWFSPLTINHQLRAYFFQLIINPYHQYLAMINTNQYASTMKSHFLLIILALVKINQH